MQVCVCVWCNVVIDTCLAVEIMAYYCSQFLSVFSNLLYSSVQNDKKGTINRVMTIAQHCTFLYLF